MGTSAAPRVCPHLMIWFKSALTGFAAAFLTIALIVAIVLVTATWSSVNEGTGGVGFHAVVITPVLFGPVVIAFALGFWWTLRRDRRKRSPPGA